MKLQDYNDGAIYRTGVHSYEVHTSHGTGKGATVAEALKDLANKQVKQEVTLHDIVTGKPNADGAVEFALVASAKDQNETREKAKKRKSSKKKKQTD